MAASEVNPTASNVKRVISGQGAQVRDCGEAITAGDICYSTGSSDYFLANADSTHSGGKIGTADTIAIALDTGSTNDPIAFAKNGETVELGAVLTAYRTYYISDTDGNYLEEADLGELNTGDAIVRIGYSISTSQLVIDYKDFGVTAP